jgi:hypothetical protein
LSYDDEVRGVGLIVLIAASACTREPAEAVCPPLSPGQLVVTEIRGSQDPEDTWGSWLELYNASGRAVDLAGLQLRFRREDGSAEIPVLVRRSLEVAPGGYAVLGLFDDADPPPHVDYGFLGDDRGGWLAAAAIDVEACGAQIDRASYGPLPARGSYSLGGAPDAERNDLPTSWCTDATQIGPACPGTPGVRNIGCP